MSLKYRTIKIDLPTLQALDKLKSDLQLSSYSKAIRVALLALNEHQSIALSSNCKVVSADEFLNENIKY